ncbi:MAG: threonine/serine exporter family protein [Mailhella sp.]|nr:threonine/serine exporter family protein [Mailhella sp.]
MPEVWIVQLATAFTGSIGFALLFNVPPARLFAAGFGGLLGWSVYLAIGPWYQGDVLRFFSASMCFTIYAECLARLKRTPSTVFLVPAAIPLVPGASLYRSMRFTVDGAWLDFTHQIIYTLFLASAIAGGIVCGMTLVHVAEKLLHLRQKRSRSRKHPQH